VTTEKGNHALAIYQVHKPKVAPWLVLVPETEIEAKKVLRGSNGGLSKKDVRCASD